MKLSDIIEANCAKALGSYFRGVVTASVAAAAIGREAGHVSATEVYGPR